QVMGRIVADYARFAGGTSTFVSIAAGTTIATLARHLPGPTPIIRCMPNTPAAIAAGTMECYDDTHVTAEALGMVEQLLSTSGLVEWVEDEALMDAVTAISGSGPAYVFHMIECLNDAGVTLGLAPDLAAKMAMQTVMGAGRLAAEAGDPPARLREQVT